MDNFTFHNPTRIIFGKGSVGQIGGVIKKEAGVKRLLLVAGGGSIRKNGVYDTVARSLKEAGIAWVEAWGVRPNPVLAKTRKSSRRPCGKRWTRYWPWAAAASSTPPNPWPRGFSYKTSGRRSSARWR